jgi:Tol biopolymer transport system component
MSCPKALPQPVASSRLPSGKRLRTTVVTAAFAAFAALLPATAVDATPTAQNGLIAFTGKVGAGTQLFTLRPDGTGLTQLTHDPSKHNVSEPSWSPDGTRIAFDRDQPSSAGGGVYVMAADGSHRQAVSSRKYAFAGAPAWSPDGRRIVFSGLAMKPCEQGLRLVDASGRFVRSITLHTGAVCERESWDLAPAFSPDGKWIAFRHQRSESGAIFVIRLDGSDLRRVTPYAGDYGNPHWSPDGSRILFHSNENEHPGQSANLFTVRPDGSALTQLTSFTGGSLQAFGGIWSPDGTQIAYHKLDAATTDDLYLLDANGANERRLTSVGAAVDPRESDWGTRQG